MYIPLRERLQVLQVPGVVQLVGSSGLPRPLPHAEIETIRDAMTKGLQAHPHPYLKVGSRVRITRGPLEGLARDLAAQEREATIVVSVDLIMRSISIDVDAAEVEPAEVAGLHFRLVGFWSESPNLNVRDSELSGLPEVVQFIGEGRSAERTCSTRSTREDIPNFP